MPDRTKMGRDNLGKGPNYTETDNPDTIRSAYDQNTKIPGFIADGLLETYALRAVGNQMAGAPGAVIDYQYGPTGEMSVKRKGLIDGGGSEHISPLPKSRKYTK